MMPGNGLVVFDLDGTLIGVNSFREICKRFLLKLIRRRCLFSCLIILVNYGLRKAGFLTHIQFKKRIIFFYESWLSEKEKTELASQVFQEYLHPVVYEQFLSTDNSIISTACPSAFVSRMPIQKQCVVLSSCQADNSLPSEDNYKQGKVENIMAFYGVNQLHIHRLYTDSEDDRSLMDCSEQVYIIRNGSPVKVK